MDLQLTEEQELIIKMAREFAETEVGPKAAEVDKNHRFPEETVARMAELGLMGIPIPEEYGGSGSDYLTYVMVVEELARACATTGVILSVHMSVCTYPIFQLGSDDQKKKYVVPLAAGEKLGAFALTEPGAGSDAAAQQTTAVLDGGHYVLNGTKCFITNGAYADVFIVAAMTDKSKGTKGISTFIVEKGFPGFSVGQTEDKMGLKGSSTTEIILKECRVPVENLLGKEGDGFKVAMAALDGGRISIAAQAVGIAQASLDASVAYAKERKQFGKPIASFQAIQFMIAEMATKIEAARGLVHRAAWLKDHHLPVTQTSAMAKYYAAEVASWCSNRAVQIHGGAGYTTAYPAERLMRDAKVTEIYEGTTEIQKMVIAGSLLR
ncbi:acyl-CoA dehydrogenase [Candidatus Formimonas warabiya]|uniref:Acyl-CoA dehydrogenase n=1 Tax=Formimonas warabiya TaxID=1761012 RepID=A0A3G1KZ56_FORW1|nr:acyl-CoA dehydrogenase [Candidatus Formimonas warabiya]ATW27495.1 acyl-CoA dehydrogenase [Candidatus Formimonas warabiya]